MALRKRFLEIIGDWSQPSKVDLEDIPRRLKKVHMEFEELTADELKLVDFMNDVQLARYYFHKRQKK
jgi:hypothetical protein